MGTIMFKVAHNILSPNLCLSFNETQEMLTLIILFFQHLEIMFLKEAFCIKVVRNQLRWNQRTLVKSNGLSGVLMLNLI